MKNLGPTPKALSFDTLNKEIWITPSEYTQLREYAKEHNQTDKFIQWHKSKLLVFTKKEA